MAQTTTYPAQLLGCVCGLLELLLCPLGELLALGLVATELTSQSAGLGPAGLHLLLQLPHQGLQVLGFFTTCSRFGLQSRLGLAKKCCKSTTRT